MKQLGSYSLQRNLGGTDAAQIWLAQTSESGQPVLVFVLPAAHLPAARPDLAGKHPALLTLPHSGVAEVPGEDGAPGGRAAYLAGLLPPGAQPLDSVSHAGLLGLLGALSALHRSGSVHGGLGRELLWRAAPRPGVGGAGVYLAGAGVPWQWPADPDPDFAQDVRRLGQALSGLREEADLPAGWLAALRSAAGARAAQELLDRWSGSGAGAPAVAPAAASAPAVAPVGAANLQTFSPRPLSPWPWLLTSVALAGTLAGSLWAYQHLQVPPGPSEPPPCCEVQYTVSGPQIPVRLQVLEAPPQLTVPPEQAEITAPGTMQLPGPGAYRIRVSADGYAPQTISVTVPRSVPVAIAIDGGS